MWPDATKIESEDFGHMQAVWQRDVVAVCIVHISEYSQISKAFLSLVAAFVPLLGIQG